MLPFFRRLTKSWPFLALFAILMIGFVITGFESPSSWFGGSAPGDGPAIATVGKQAIGEGQAAQEIQQAQRNLEQPVDLATFVRDGGADAVISQIINRSAIQQFADLIGIRVGKRLVDGEIAAMADFRSAAGQFDESTFRQRLAMAGITENNFRNDLTQAALLRMILTPVAGGARATPGFVRPYALLQLEQRQGYVAALPAILFAQGWTPSDAELKSYYDRNAARYSQAELRVVRYAVIDPAARVAGQSTPTEAQIAEAYRKDAARYAARETRDLTRIIVPTQAQADQFATRLRAGESPAAVATGAGLEPRSVTGVEKMAFAKETSPAAADAAFAPGAAKGSILVARTPLGFAVIRVDAITAIPARTLDQARDEIVVNLSRQMSEDAAAREIETIEGEADKRIPFATIAQRHGLDVRSTGPITADGTRLPAPGSAPVPASPEIQAIVKSAFLAQQGDLAAIEPFNNGQTMILWEVERILPAAGRPLTEVKPQVVADMQHDRALRLARQAADAIVKKANAGMAFAQALASAGVALPPAQPIQAQRREVMADPENAPPPLIALFGLRAKHARVVPVPQGQGWFIVYVDQIQGGNPVQAVSLEGAAIGPFSNLLAREYVEQFTNATRAVVGVSENQAAIQQLKQRLAGGATR